MAYYRSNDVDNNELHIANTPAKVVMVKNLKTVALDRNNYFAWRIQFTTNMKGNDLYGYLSEDVVLNSPAAKKQDQLILGWIFLHQDSYSWRNRRGRLCRSRMEYSVARGRRSVGTKCANAE